MRVGAGNLLTEDWPTAQIYATKFKSFSLEVFLYHCRGMQSSLANIPGIVFCGAEAEECLICPKESLIYSGVRKQ